MSDYNDGWANEATEQAWHALNHEPAAPGREHNPAEIIARLTYLDDEDGMIDRTTEDPFDDVMVVELADRLKAAYAGKLPPVVSRLDDGPGEIDWAEIADQLTCDDWRSSMDDEIAERGAARVRAEMVAMPPAVRELRWWLFENQKQDEPVDVDRLMAFINCPAGTRQHVKHIGE